MLSPNPFTPLLGPFRYACQRDFAQLDTVRNLRVPLERALADAKSQGLTAADLAPFKRELLSDVCGHALLALGRLRLRLWGLGALLRPCLVELHAPLTLFVL